MKCIRCGREVEGELSICSDCAKTQMADDNCHIDQVRRDAQQFISHSSSAEDKEYRKELFEACLGCIINMIILILFLMLLVTILEAVGVIS